MPYKTYSKTALLMAGIVCLMLLSLNQLYFLPISAQSLHSNNAQKPIMPLSTLKSPLGDEFVLKAPSPEKLTSVTADPMTGYVYAQENQGTAFYRYDPSLDEWTARASAPIHSGNNGGAVYLGGKIYTSYAGNNNDIGVYDIATNTWMPSIENELALGTANMTTHEEYIYMVGGSTFKRYDPINEIWQELDAPPIFFSAWGGLSYFNQTIYGHRGNGSNAFAKYDIANDNWTTLDPLPGNPVLGSAIDPIAGIYYASGPSGGTDWYAFDLASETWNESTNTLFDVGDGGMAYVDRHGVSGIYFVQGVIGTGFGLFKTYVPPPTPTPPPTFMPTNTPTSTNSPTDTPTAGTPTNSPTNSPTNTPTDTPTDTPTNTPSNPGEPIVSNVVINPTNLDAESGLFVVPQAGTEISVRYDYYDPNGNSEANTLIRWTRGDQFEQQEQPRLNEEETVPSGTTLAEERWCVTVTPHNGQLYGQPVEVCAYIESIPNLRPEVSVMITPQKPRDNDPLTLSYTYIDGNNEPQVQELAEVRWYRDGVLQPDLNDELVVPPDETFVGEEWCVLMRLHDGQEFGPISLPDCVMISPAGNIVPSVQNGSIIPSNPLDSDDLTLIYNLDPDGGSEEGDTQIRWYRNEQLQPRFNDQKSVEANLTEVGQIWSATVRPHDGEDYGALFKTDEVLISADTINTLPEVTNLKITPAEPSAADNLVLSYDFQDADDDLQGDTIIRWYKDLEHLEQYDGLTTISADETEAEQVWHADVIPHDGQAYGANITAHSVTIDKVNSAPEVSDVYLLPDNPGDEEKLVLDYQYYDENDDLQSDTQIRWLVDLASEPAYDDQTVIPAESTTVGEEWCAFVRPFDGRDYGTTVASNCVMIQEMPENTLPVITEIHLRPFQPASSDDIELSYRYFDGDGDHEGDTSIKWFKDGTQQEQFNDQTVIPASVTLPDQMWYATIQPHDGHPSDFGDEVSTITITINTPPEVLDASIMQGTENEDLILEYEYDDHNDDPYGEPKIQWNRNGSHQPDYDNQFMIPHQAVFGGDRWQATIWAFDGYEYSNKLRTIEVHIDSQLYLPAILSQKIDTLPTATPSPTSTPTPTPTPPMPAGPYEENNAQETAYGPLIFGKGYQAYAEDKDDWYYIILNETSSIKVDVTNYTPNDKETEKAEGQVAVYQEYFDTDNQPQRQKLANDGRGGSTMVIPNQDYPTALNDLPPGKYLIRIYTVENYNQSDLYRLEVQYQ